MGHRRRKELRICAKLKLPHRSLEFGELVTQHNGVAFQSTGLYWCKPEGCSSWCHACFSNTFPLWRWCRWLTGQPVCKRGTLISVLCPPDIHWTPRTAGASRLSPLSCRWKCPVQLQPHLCSVPGHGGEKPGLAFGSMCWRRKTDTEDGWLERVGYLKVTHLEENKASNGNRDVLLKEDVQEDPTRCQQTESVGVGGEHPGRQGAFAPAKVQGIWVRMGAEAAGGVLKVGPEQRH